MGSGIDTVNLALASCRPCPFATEEDEKEHALQIIGEAMLSTLYVSCQCGARSPFGKSPLAVVARWNTRYADIIINRTQADAGRALIRAERQIDEVEKKFSDMQVENNKLLERARTAEAALELTTKLAEKAVTDHG